MVCGVVPLVSAVCGARGWASVSACFWDVCGFVGAPLAPRRFRFRRAVRACVLGPGLACAQPFLAGLSGCVFCALVFSFLFFFSGLCGPCPSIPFLSGWAGGSLFFFFVSLFPVVCCYWLGVAGFGWVVPLCLCGGPFFGAFWGGVWPPVVVLAGGLAAVGCFCVYSPSPLLFWGGGGLPVPPSAFPGLAHALACIQCCLPGCVFSCVLCGRVPAPWVGWALYTVGSAPLLAGLGLGSAGWAAAPGGCLWFWVRGLGLCVPFPLCGAGCNLLGGPPPLSPGALWPRVWPAVLVCGVVARRLPGCAVAGFG